jgi:hypothetical protein
VGPTIDTKSILFIVGVVALACAQTALSYLEDHWPEALLAMPSTEALTSGLIGPTPHAPEVSRRLGDVMVTMRGSHTLVTGPEMA